MSEKRSLKIRLDDVGKLSFKTIYMIYFPWKNKLYKIYIWCTETFTKLQAWLKFASVDMLM